MILIVIIYEFLMSIRLKKREAMTCGFIVSFLVREKFIFGLDFKKIQSKKSNPKRSNPKISHLFHQNTGRRPARTGRTRPKQKTGLVDKVGRFLCSVNLKFSVKRIYFFALSTAKKYQKSPMFSI